jgi:hypothetical protein
MKKICFFPYCVLLQRRVNPVFRDVTAHNVQYTLPNVYVTNTEFIFSHTLFCHFVVTFGSEGALTF